MCAGLLCAMHPRWQTQADCDAFRVFYCHSLRCQHVRLWSRCRPCLKHLRCGLACEVKQTALDEIRVRWAWLVTNQQPALACSSLWHRLPTLGQTKRELALRFASSTYFISAGSIKESLIHRGRLRFSILMMLVECCCQFTEKKKNPHLDHRCSCISGPAKTNCFFSVCVSCSAASSENGFGALSRLPGQILRHDYVLGWNQITGRCHTWSSEPSMTLCVFLPPPSGLNCCFGLCYFPPNLWPCSAVLVLRKYFSINLLILPSRSLPFGFCPISTGWRRTNKHQASLPVLWRLFKRRLRWTRCDSTNIERSAAVLQSLMRSNMTRAVIIHQFFRCYSVDKTGPTVRKLTFIFVMNDDNTFALFLQWAKNPSQ